MPCIAMLVNGNNRQPNQWGRNSFKHLQNRVKGARMEG